MSKQSTRGSGWSWSGARAGSLVAAVMGIVLTIGVAILLDMPLEDSLHLAAFATAAAVIVGLFGALILRLSSGSSIGLKTAIIALSAVGAVAAGSAVAANQMFLSSHDLRALAVVIVAAGTVAAVFAIELGRGVASTSRSLGDSARLIGEGEIVTVADEGVAREFTTLGRELEEVSKRLDEARARERTLEASRRELVAWVSHDLRTPLAGIRAMAEALEDEVVTDAETRARYHQAMRVEADRLAGLVDDLFELSRINAGSLRLHVERVSLGDLVSDALSSTAALARVKGVNLERSLPSNPPELELSSPEMGRVLRNLLENAIRHTPGDGTVWVEAGTDDEQAYVSVADACGGIPTQDLGRVFDVAFRGESARTPGGEGGAGLGLAIARGIVEAHDGEIDVRNERGGCRFIVRLPLAGTLGGSG